ncbi:MAG: DinB family protein [Patescibacteria group bacterium]|jgi:hypothetical protein
MTKEESIQRLKNGHKRFLQVINSLSPKQIVSQKVLGNWTTKDVIAHLLAWNWEQLKAVDKILTNHKPEWWGQDETVFNQKEINKRANCGLDKILKEFDDSFDALVLRINSLSERDWYYEASEKGSDSKAINIDSMFGYTYQGEDHEGGHAKQIEKVIKK